MTKYVHCAFIKHDGCEKPFLFSVGREEKLRGGVRVLCDTRYGAQEGNVFGDSFYISEEGLASVAKSTGATLPLREIVGAVEVVMATKTVYFQGHQEVVTADDMPF